MEIFGYIASVFIGISLGLIGSGGSILTVPVMVYLFHVNPLLATTYSLLVVGISAIVGAYPKYKAKQISFKTAILFVIPSLISVYFTRSFLLPIIPENIFIIYGFEITKSIFIMVFFAVLMLASSISMFTEKKCINCPDEPADLGYKYPQIIIQGLFIGLITGLVGAGGGFLIIPSLVMLTKLSMKRAVGTSLTIVAFNSIFGFITSILHHEEVLDYKLLGLVITLASIGIFIGTQLSKKIDGHSLKKGFGVFVFAMGVYIVMKELFL